MSDIFVSYASEDRPRVKVLSQALEAQGWSVWWDRSIPFGKRFHQVIEQELAAARSVMVIWSEQSVGSDWVRAEAGEGMNRGILVPVAIDDVPPPLVFRQIQTANLAGWEGDQESPVFRKLMADLTSLLGAPPDPNVAPLPREAGEPAGTALPPAGVTRPEPEPRPETEKRRRGAAPPWPWLLAGALGTALVALLLWLWLTPGEPERGGPVPQDVETGWTDGGPGETDGGVEDDPPADAGGEEGGERGEGDTTGTTDSAEPADPAGAEDPGEVVQPPPPPPPAAPPPRILRFVAEPARIDVYQRARLSWSTENASGVTLEGVGTVADQGQETVYPKETTTYRLTARSTDGRTTEASVRVTVARRVLTLRAREMADLDAGATDAAFDRGDLALRIPTDGSLAHLTLWNDSRMRVLRDADDCRPETGLGSNALSISNLRAGSHLCVRTSENRLVVCRIEGVGGRSSDATLALDCAPL
jgi:hypothetical protein